MTLAQRFYTWYTTAWPDLLHFPWRDTVLTLRDRFREDRLGLTASSLTFTTSIALVPLFTVALAIFTAFPMFAKLQSTLQSWLVQSLIPDNIARQVLGYLTQFSRQANKLGLVGLVAVLVTAIALILTIDRTLNGIWRVKKPRPLAQRVLIYWAALTLGPLFLGASLALSSYLLAASQSLVDGLPISVRLLISIMQFTLVAGGMAALYRYVPHTFVKWSHAWVGGLCVAAALELAKRALTWYLSAVPTYSMVYGAFATLPILLVWIYLSWVIVLMGAVIAAYMPSLLAGVVRRPAAKGWRFQMALALLKLLAQARHGDRPDMDASTLARALQVDVLQIEPVLEGLIQLRWIGQLVVQGDFANANTEPGYLLLIDPEKTTVEPLVTAFLLDKTLDTTKLWDSTGWSALPLQHVL